MPSRDRFRARPCLEVLEGRDLLATLLWIGAANANWNVAANWIETSTGANQVPVNDDSLVFDPTKTVQVGGNNVTGTNTASKDNINNLVVKDITLAKLFAGPITLDQSLGVTGTLLMEGGEFAGTGGINVATTGRFDWCAGKLGVNVTVGAAGAVKATMTITGRGGRGFAEDVTLTNHGNLTWTAGDVAMGDGSKIVNETGGTIIISGGDNASMFFRSNGAVPFLVPPVVMPALVNKGTLTRAVGNAPVTFSVLVQNSGTLAVSSGEIVFKKGFTQTAGTTSLTGTGKIALGPLAPLTLQGGMLSGTGTIKGNVANTSGTVRPGADAGPGTLTIEGDYTQSAGGKLVSRVSNAGATALLDVKANGKLGGKATLGGTLQVDKPAAYTPPNGTAIEVLKARKTAGDWANAPTISNNTWNAGGVNGLQFWGRKRATGYKLVAGVNMPAQAPIGIQLVAANPNLGFGQNGTFTVTVTTTGTAPAEALLYDGNQLLGTVVLTSAGGYAYTGTLTTSALGAGSHVITAAFDGTDTQAPGWSSDVNVTVTPDYPLATSLLVALCRTQAYPGEMVTITANLAAPGNAGGTVVFRDGDTVLGTATIDANGIAQFCVIDLSYGSHSITAEYLGDTNFEGSLAAATTLEMLAL